ncbi:MAG: hypothetical protein DME26_20650, partial [Verrucomicrobia bacterium]
MSQPSSDLETHPPAASGSPAASTAMSLAQSLCIGSIGFSVVSTVIFATVAFGEGWLYGHLGVALTYAFWTLIFILGGGTVAARLNRGFR